MHGVAGDQFPEQRIDLPCPTVEDSRPFELGEAVGQALGLGGVVELCERVVLLHEAEFLLDHLLGQPFEAVDVDLDGERQPGLQADVDQAELGIEEVYQHRTSSSSLRKPHSVYVSADVLYSRGTDHPPDY